MELKLTRNWPKSGYTIGRLYVNGVYWCNTLEDTDRGLHAGMTDAQVRSKKVYGMTAIPRGQYHVELKYSAKFAGKEWGRKYNGLVPLLERVKGFDGIRIHPGSTAADSLGCVLVGENTKKGEITSSRKWYYKLMDEVMMPAYLKGEMVTIDIQ